MPTLCQQLLHFCKCEHAMHVSGWNLTTNCFSQGAVFLSIALFLLSPTHRSEVTAPILPSQSELIQRRELRKPIMVIFELTWHDYVGEHFHYKHPTWHHYRRMCKRFFWFFVVDFIVSTTRKPEEDNERGCCDYHFDTNIQQDISDLQVFNWSLSRFCELWALVWRNMLRLSRK